MDLMKTDMFHNSIFLQFDELDETNGSDDNEYALVVLNYQMPLLTLFLWKKACLRICADGGANQLYDCLPQIISCDDPIKLRTEYKPDVIKGDLDSIRPEVKAFYQGLVLCGKGLPLRTTGRNKGAEMDDFGMELKVQGTKVVDESHDQDTTDLHKCISYIIKDHIPSVDKHDMKILVVGALGGRLDHEFGNLNVLHSFSGIRIILLSDENMTYLLSRDFTHKIHIDSSIEGPYCGLVPLGAPSASTTTTGLKWNLEKTPMKFGGLISVCNQHEDEIVTVSSDTDLVWTITIQKLNKHLQKLVPNMVGN